MILTSSACQDMIAAMQHTEQRRPVDRTSHGCILHNHSRACSRNRRRSPIRSHILHSMGCTGNSSLYLAFFRRTFSSSWLHRVSSYILTFSISTFPASHSKGRMMVCGETDETMHSLHM